MQVTRSHMVALPLGLLGCSSGTGSPAGQSGSGRHGGDPGTFAVTRSGTTKMSGGTTASAGLTSSGSRTSTSGKTGCGGESGTGGTTGAAGGTGINAPVGLPDCGVTPTLANFVLPHNPKMTYTAHSVGGQSRKYLLRCPDNDNDTHPLIWFPSIGSNKHDPSPMDQGLSTPWNPQSPWNWSTQFCSPKFWATVLKN